MKGKQQDRASKCVAKDKGEQDLYFLCLRQTIFVKYCCAGILWSFKDI